MLLVSTFLSLDSASSLWFILLPHEILLPPTLSVVSAMSTLVSCKVGWLVTGIRGLGASNWRRPWSRGWVLDRLGVPAAGETDIVCIFREQPSILISQSGEED